MERYWTIRPPAPESHFALFAEYSRPMAQLLYNRGLRERAAAQTFLARQVTDDDPFRMRGMKAAVERIRCAISQGELVLVHGDFDADGVTSTTLMVTGLRALGAQVAPYIPNRVDEGYGLNETAIHKMGARGISLMVTVDCGIRANAEIELANTLGIDVIVTDHHSPGNMPSAHAIVNPHQEGCEYPHKELSGVGIAWKMIQALWREEQRAPLGLVEEGFDPSELLDLVAIGTVADIVPLTGENRTLVWRGMEQLRRTRRPGLLALMESARVTPQSVNTESIAFFLGPRINAAGRLDSAMRAYQLLRAADPGQARGLAEKLESQNRTRQALTRDAMARAQSQVVDHRSPLLLVSDEHCPEGIVGLVAGRLLEEYYRPTVVVSQGPEWSRASCRSIPEFNITRALDEVAPLLERHGGHAAAAGFTIRTENLPALETSLSSLARERLSRVAPGGDLARLRPRLVADGALPLHEITEELVDQLAELAPFGAANQEPLWMCRNVTVRDARPVGNDGSHLKLTLQDAASRPWSAIAFRQGSRAKDLPKVLDIAFSVKRTEWQGRERLELQLADMRPATGHVVPR